MQQEQLFTGNTEEEIWQQLNQHLTEDILQYIAVIQQNGKKIILDIDIDLGGGFESGYATTSFTAPVQLAINFRFAIHEEGLLDEAGKFFGMQDVVIGYPEFDDKVIIKTNDEEKVKALFSDAEVRATLSQLPDFTFKIENKEGDETDALLQLYIEEGITDSNRLRRLYHSFYKVLVAVEAV